MQQRYSCIFAALDGASTQEAVAERAVSLASDNEARLVFGHVIDSVPYETLGVDFDALCSEVEERLKSDLSSVFNKAQSDKRVPSFELLVRVGRVTDTLENCFIDSVKPDLVICGERGLSSIKYAFVGSVSTFLIRNVRSDVLVVKQD